MRPRERGRLTPSTARRTVSTTSRRGRGAVPWPSRPGDRAPDSGGSGPPASRCPVAPIPRDPPLMHDVSPMHWRQHPLKIKRLLTVGMAAALVLSLAGTASAASPKGKSDSKAHKSDNIPGKLAKKQDALKQKAREMVFKGKATSKGKNQVVKVAKGQFVELAFEGEDQILTFLGEFGDDQATHITARPAFAHGGTPGPLHNRSRSRTAQSTTPRSGPTTSTSPTTRTCSTTRTSTRRWRTGTWSSRTAATASTATSATGSRSRSTRLPTAATTAAASSARATSAVSSSTRRTRWCAEQSLPARPGGHRRAAGAVRRLGSLRL